MKGEQNYWLIFFKGSQWQDYSWIFIAHLTVFDYLSILLYSYDCFIISFYLFIYILFTLQRLKNALLETIITVSFAHFLYFWPIYIYVIYLKQKLYEKYTFIMKGDFY